MEPISNQNDQSLSSTDFTPNIPPQSNTDNYELNVFLYTTFQDQLEQAQLLFHKPPPDETHIFQYKYEGREILQTLAKNQYIQLNNQQNPHFLEACSNGIIKYYLGLNYFETEEYAEAVTHLNQSLGLFNKLADDIKFRYLNILQDIYNTLGIIHCNRANHNEGLPHFAKAEELYTLVESPNNIHITHNFNQFLKSTTTKNKLPQQKDSQNGKECFGFFIDGGLDKTKLEQNYTQTVFYMAQAYTKLGDSEKGVFYCAKTMERQLQTNTYEIIDWCSNCIYLAEYFLGMERFANVEYLLFGGLSLLNSQMQSIDSENHSQLSQLLEMKASFQKTMGIYYANRLRHGIKFSEGDFSSKSSKEIQEETSKINEMVVNFHNINIAWPNVHIPLSLDDLKLLFRLANTQFKKALEFFSMDGYVTQNVQIRQQISQLYKQLALVEPDIKRVIAMLERRRDIIEPIASEINPKVYHLIIQEVWNEVAAIYQDLFELKLEEAQSKKKNKVAKQQAKQNGLNACKYAQELISYFESINEKTDEVFSAMRSANFIMAKMYSRLPTDDYETELEYLTKSYEKYLWIKQSFENHKQLSELMKKELELCTEMCQNLPHKIDKINYLAKTTKK